jgi:hypothetical protein
MKKFRILETQEGYFIPQFCKYWPFGFWKGISKNYFLFTAKAYQKQFCCTKTKDQANDRIVFFKAYLKQQKQRRKNNL